MKYIRFFITLAFWEIFLCSNLFAGVAEKEVNLTEECKSIKFDVEFESDTPETYMVEVLKPNGKTSGLATRVNEKLYSYTVNDPDDGVWKIRVDTDGDPSKVVIEDTSEENSSEEETTELTAEDKKIEKTEEKKSEGENADGTDKTESDVIPFKITASLSNTRLISEAKDIVITKDIVGLKMYFNDDDFVAEWADTTCGNIDIEVTNADTMQKIDRQTVTGQKYTLHIDEGMVKRIYVSITPATSANIEGAGNGYEIAVDNHPRAEVTFDDITVTRSTMINTNVSLKEPYTVYLYVNERLVGEPQKLAAGIYDFDVPLDVGQNDIRICIEDDGGNIRSYSRNTERDVTAPILRLENNLIGVQTQQESIVISGSIEGQTTFEINGVPVAVELDHSFNYVYKLKDGLNNILLRAEDEAGNITEYAASVTKTVPEEEVKEPVSFPVKTAVPLILIIAAIIFLGKSVLSTIRGRRRKNGRRNKKRHRGKK